jgi:CBS domain containing-hemolysin-like protein
MDWLIGLLIIALSLLAQAFFAGSEMGLISFNRIRLRHQVDQGDKKAALIQRLLNDPQRLFGTTLVGVNVSVIIGSTIASGLVNRYVSQSQSWGPAIATALMLPLTVMFGQIVPMSLFRAHSASLVRLTIIPLTQAYWVLLPAVHAATFVSRKIADLFGKTTERASPFSSRDEIRLLLEEGSKKDFLQQDGLNMLHRIFDLHKTHASKAMIPLIEMVAAPLESTVEGIVKLMRKTGFSTIPIYEERVDNVVGTVSAGDLMAVEDRQQPVRPLVKKAFIVPESKPVDDILLEFGQSGERFAVVVDEYGGVSGILTVEDILEEIVGEIADEYEGAVPQPVSTRKGKLVVSARMSVREFNEEFSTDISDEEAETIGGLLTAITGRVPQPGEKVHCHGMEFEVLEGSDRKVSKVAIKPLTKGEMSSR